MHHLLVFLILFFAASSFFLFISYFLKKFSSLFGDFMPKRTVFSLLLTLHFQLHPTIKISTTTGGHRRGKTFFVPLLHASQTTNTKPSISSLSLISFSSHLFKTNPKHTHVTCPISPLKNTRWVPSATPSSSGASWSTGASSPPATAPPGGRPIRNQSE